MKKLTLSVDPAVVARAHAYAKRHGVSVSRMVETYLLAVTTEKPSSKKKATPILDSLTGILKSADVEDYRRHLAEKYR